MTLIICGAGQYGLVAKEIAEEMGIFSDIKFVDDYCENAIGKICDLEHIAYDAAFIAIGNHNVRCQLNKHIDKIISLIHPKAIIMPSAKIGSGSIIEAGAVVCSNVEIGQGCVIMANSLIGHDAKVGDFCNLRYNCTIPERCVVPEHTIVNCNVVYSNLV